MRLRLCIAALSAAALIAPARADSPSLTNEDIIVLAEAGLTEDFIVRRIDASQPKYDVSAKALAELAKRGLSARVLEAMLARVARPAGEPSTARAAAANGHDAFDVEVSWLDGEREPARLGLRVLAQAKVGGRLGALLTGGVKSIKGKAYLLGPHAQVRSRTGIPVFHIRPPEGVAIEEFVIVQMDKKANRREIEVESRWGLGGFKNGLRFEQVMPSDIQQTPTGSFRVAPQQRLPIGEYFLYIMGSADARHGIAGKGYEFAVD